MQIKSNRWYRFIMTTLLALPCATVFADGTETLGLPSEPLALAGSGFVAAGTGLDTQPGVIEIEVPAGATINQVLVYWAGELRVAPGDSITVDGNAVVGTLIGGPTLFFNFQGPVQTASYRADITDLGVIAPGANSVSIDGLSFDWANSGAGIVVLYDDGVSLADTQVLDGVDVAFYQFPEPRQNTLPQTFTFDAADVDRVAKLGLFVGSVLPDSPHTIDITVAGNTTTLVDPLGSLDGTAWDTLIVPVDVPAGATDVTVQIFSTPSGNPLGSSILWVTAALSVPLPEAEEPDCVECDGGVHSLTLVNDDNHSQWVWAFGTSSYYTNTYFYGQVDPGESFTIATNNVNSKLPKYVYIRYGWRYELLRTDCRNPLNPGVEVGPFSITEAINVGGEPLCGTEPEADLCDAGRPQSLTLRYTGEDCENHNHWYSHHYTYGYDDAYICHGDAHDDNRVYIVASDNMNSYAHHADVYFKGYVDLNATFDVDSTVVGDNHLPSWTWVSIFNRDPRYGGHRLQKVAIRTKCDRPIAPGATFGALEIVNFEAE
ncbi:MAG: hypothetical protein H6817_09485 [Phycisphaerales bacterium]|nr:hypothetical protein [Phycisphaerales bacterium]